MKPVNLVEANLARAIAIAKVLAPRISSISGTTYDGKPYSYVDNPWVGFDPREGLEGHLTSSDLLTYQRKSNPQAKLLMGFLKMTNIKEAEKDDPVLIAENIIEEHTDVYNFKKPIKYSETIEHTFSKTETFEEAAKQAWEVAAKASLSVEYAGIKGAFEASAKYGQELSQRHSTSVTQTDKISKYIEIQGPVELKYQAKRSSSKFRQHIKAVCDFDFKLYFQVPDPVTGLGVFEWSNFQTLFIPQIKNFAPEDELKNMNVWSVFGGQSNLPTEEEIEAIVQPSDKIIEFYVDYDNVNEQSLNVI